MRSSLLLAGLGALLWAALHWRWNTASGAAAARQFIPLTIQAGAAALIAVTTYGPSGDHRARTAGNRPASPAPQPESGVVALGGGRR